MKNGSFGKQEHYYENGNIERIENYGISSKGGNFGAMDGIQYYYHKNKNGAIQKTSDYSFGKKHGHEYEFGLHFNKIGHACYKHGHKVIVESDLEGQVSETFVRKRVKGTLCCRHHKRRHC